MNARLAEIRARKAEIRAQLEGKEQVDLQDIEAELQALDEEQKELEKRQAMAEKINLGHTGGLEERKKPKVPETTEQRKNLRDTEEYRNAFMGYVCRGEAMPAEFRDNETTMTTDVGALVPQVTLNKIIEKIMAWGMILPLVTRTAYRTGMIIPTSTIKPVATWVAEGAGSGRQKKTLDASITFGHYKLRCAVSVTLETEYMTYSAFALETAIIKGTGTGQPQGILTDDTKGQKVTVAALDYQALIKAEAELPIEYENGAVWCMTKKTFMQFVGMVDKNGQPIANVTRGLAAAPERYLLGRRVV
ncbi:phage major capsid protein, partial [uncultured Megasphaera sp.]|uniref:phage major capsid protein n=1 Tax=uncultured Megasphaera sp. TaxID=165188 RepID=UPI00265CA8B9